MSDLPLRAACIHGRYEPHIAWVPDLPKDSPQQQTKQPCPGGQDIPIDPLVEAARLLVASQTVERFGIFEPLRYGLTQFDAAIGDGDE